MIDAEAQEYELAEHSSRQVVRQLRRSGIFHGDQSGAVAGSRQSPITIGIVGNSFEIPRGISDIADLGL